MMASEMEVTILAVPAQKSNRNKGESAVAAAVDG